MKRTNDYYIKFIDEWFKKNNNLTNDQYKMLRELVWIMSH